jgi:TRAP-type C4-dicarboxylate transport system permease small subunit
MVAEVVMRYYFYSPLIWVVEVSETILLFVAFLGAAWLLRGEGHVRVDLVLNFLHPKTRTMLDGFTSIVGALCCAVVVWYGVTVTWDCFVKGSFEPTSLEIPSAYVLLIIPVGAFLLFIQCLRRSYGYFKRLRASSGDKE